MASKKQRRAIRTCSCETCRQHPYSIVAEHHRAIPLRCATGTIVNRVLVTLDERNRRRFVGLLALQWGRGGIAHLIEVTGLSRNTIRRGCEEIQHPQRAAPLGRRRRPGGGRPRTEKSTRTS